MASVCQISDPSELGAICGTTELPRTQHLTEVISVFWEVFYRLRGAEPWPCSTLWGEQVITYAGPKGPGKSRPSPGRVAYDRVMTALLNRVMDDLMLGPVPLDVPLGDARPVPLPSRLATGELARTSIAAALLAAGIGRPPILDSDRIAWAYRSDRLLLIDGAAPEVWSPYSGFWMSADGWIRTHGNYPHHRQALLVGLRLSEQASADEVRTAITAASARETIDRVTASGGLAVKVSPEAPRVDAQLRARPLVELRRVESAPRSAEQAGADQSSVDAPLRGLRVLDLTRVIAGPVCTRTLALLGADVLRVDPPHLSEAEWQHLDTGHGKRSALLDARSPQLGVLLDHADVVVLGYRPAAIDRLSLSPDRLASRYPGLITAQLSAWGDEHPDRAGFDSLVQAESGIALLESADGETPGALPAQALDHSAGYLLAAGVCAAVRHRREYGGSWRVSTSLRRVAAELLGMPRQPSAAPEADEDPAGHTQTFDVDGRTVTTVRSALPGFSFEAPRPWGSDAPQW